MPKSGSLQKYYIAMRKLLLIFILCISAAYLFSQSLLNQTIRGTVIDKNTQAPLPGAKIILLNSDPVVGTPTDIDGKFKLENVPIGRVGIIGSYI